MASKKHFRAVRELALWLEAHLDDIESDVANGELTELTGIPQKQAERIAGQFLGYIRRQIPDYVVTEETY